MRFPIVQSSSAVAIKRIFSVFSPLFPIDVRLFQRKKSSEKVVNIRHVLEKKSRQTITVDRWAVHFPIQLQPFIWEINAIGETQPHKWCKIEKLSEFRSRFHCKSDTCVLSGGESWNSCLSLADLCNKTPLSMGIYYFFPNLFVYFKCDNTRIEKAENHWYIPVVRRNHSLKNTSVLAESRTWNDRFGISVWRTVEVSPRNIAGLVLRKTWREFCNGNVAKSNLDSYLCVSKVAIRWPESWLIKTVCQEIRKFFLYHC